MVPTLKRYVEGREVLELGGGDGSFANLMVQQCHAGHVIVVEKDQHHWLRDPMHYVERVSFHWELIQKFMERSLVKHRDVVACSWPINNDEFCVHARMIMERAQYVVIVGKNDGCTAIGTTVLWKHLVLRDRLALVETPNEDLIIYGPRDRKANQDLCQTEHHGVRYDLCLTT